MNAHFYTSVEVWSMKLVRALLLLASSLPCVYNTIYTSAWVMIGNSQRSKHNLCNWHACSNLSLLVCLKPMKDSLRPHLTERKKQQSCRRSHSSFWASSSINGGDNGGTADSSEEMSMSRAFLAADLETLSLPIFLESSFMDEEALEELLLSMEAKKLSFDNDPWAEAMMDPKMPDSLNPWMIVWSMSKHKPS